MGNIDYYKDGKLIIGGIEGFSMPVDTFVLLNKSIMEVNASLMYDVGLAQGKLIDLSFQKNKLSLTDKIKAALEKINCFGLGYIELIHMTETKFTFKLDSSISKSHKKIFGLGKENVDSFTCGLLTGIMETILQEKYDGKEVLCSATGKPYCLFDIKKIS